MRSVVLLIGMLLGGAGFSSETLKPNSAVHYDLTFVGNKKATIDVEGSGKGDLDCYIFDKNTHLLMKDDTSNNSCHFEWLPKTDTSVLLVITNYSSVDDSFVLIAD